MAPSSSGASPVQVRLRDGETVWQVGADGPAPLVEDRSYVIQMRETRVGAVAARYKALMGGQPLRLFAVQIQGDEVELAWEWHPDFYAGTFTLEIWYETQRLWPASGMPGHVETNPPLAKLVREEYEAMLDELSQWTSGWLTVSPATAEGAAFPAPWDNLLARIDFLVRHWGEVTRLVEDIVRLPRRQLQREEHRVPLHGARELSDMGLAGALTGGAEWVQAPCGLSGGACRLASRLNGVLPRHVPHTRVRSTLQVPENAFVRRFLEEMRLVLGEVVTCKGAPADLLGQRREQARRLERTVTDWLRDTWISEVEPAGGVIIPTLALVRHPMYGGLWRLYQRWCRAMVLRDGGGEDLPLERTYQLYEYWCFLVLAREAAAVCGGNVEDVTRQLVTRTGARGLRVDLEPLKQVAVPVGSGVTLTYQLSVPSVHSPAAVRSYSHQMKPDFAFRLPGDDARLLLFDPKYRVAAPSVNEGLNDMHRYRDALVDQQGRRVTVGGFLICPDIRAAHQPLTQTTYQQTWDFGIVVLKPGQGCWELRRLLAGYLSHSPA